VATSPESPRPSDSAVDASDSIPGYIQCTVKNIFPRLFTSPPSSRPLEKPDLSSSLSLSLSSSRLFPCSLRRPTTQAPTLPAACRHHHQRPSPRLPFLSLSPGVEAYRPASSLSCHACLPFLFLSLRRGANRQAQARRRELLPTEVPNRAWTGEAHRQDRHHVAHRGDGGRHGPPTPARLGGRTKWRRRRRRIAAKAAGDDEDPGVKS